MALVKNNDVIQALAGANLSSARRTALPRGARCRDDLSDSHGRDPLVEDRAVRGIAVTQHRGQPSYGRKVHGARSRNAFTDVAWLPARRSNRHLSRSICSSRCRPRFDCSTSCILAQGRREIVRFDVTEHPTMVHCVLKSDRTLLVQVWHLVPERRSRAARPFCPARYVDEPKMIGSRKSLSFRC